MVSPFALAIFPWWNLPPAFLSSGRERVLQFSEAGEAWIALEEGLTVALAPSSCQCQQVASLLPGDNNGKAFFPSGLALPSGGLHSPPQVFWTCLLAVVWRGTAKALVLGDRVCGHGRT